MTKVAIEKRKPVQAVFPIQRVARGVSENGNEYRVVDSYCYANAWVGDGINLKRSAMIAASEDYLTWGNIREMHGKNAIGTCIGRATVTNEEGASEELTLGVQWDEKGAFMRAKIVDAEAMVKLDEGVYRGLSVSVIPTVMRGTDCEACKWYETSLVDRPADPDCGLLAVRAIETADTVSVVRYWDENDNWVDGPYTFGAMIAKIEQQDKMDDLYTCTYQLADSIRSILKGGGDVALMHKSVDEFAAYVKASIIGEAAEMATDRIARLSTSVTNAINRFQQEPVGDTAEKAALLTRAQSAESTLIAVRTELGQANAKVEELTKTLSRMADPTQPQPARHAPAERQFAANATEQAVDAESETLAQEYQTLARTLKDDPSEENRRAGVVRMQQIKSQLAQRGKGV